jgi:hypothetical protein
MGHLYILLIGTALPGGRLMDVREVKACEMTGHARISFRDGAWHVHSQTTSRYYRFNPSPVAALSECEDFAMRPAAKAQPRRSPRA